MRISDWSSDVCSSDLGPLRRHRRAHGRARARRQPRRDAVKGDRRMTAARMLLVEDDAALAELLTFHFEREDFLVQHPPDGEEALLFARATPPDIVMLDWMVAGLSGIEVCRRLRRAPDTTNVPILKRRSAATDQ